MDPMFRGIIGIEHRPKISAQRIGVEAYMSHARVSEGRTYLLPTLPYSPIYLCSSILIAF